MGDAIYLYYQEQLLAEEVNYVAFDWTLSIKRITSHRTSTQNEFPEAGLCLGHFLPQGSCKSLE